TVARADAFAIVPDDLNGSEIHASQSFMHSHHIHLCIRSFTSSTKPFECCPLACSAHPAGDESGSFQETLWPAPAERRKSRTPANRYRKPRSGECQQRKGCIAPSPCRRSASETESTSPRTAGSAPVACRTPHRRNTC